MSEKIRVCGLWSSKDKDDNLILSGSINPGVRVVVFANGFKEAENQPDYILYMQKAEPKKE